MVLSVQSYEGVKGAKEEEEEGRNYDHVMIGHVMCGGCVYDHVCV